MTKGKLNVDVADAITQLESMIKDKVSQYKECYVPHLIAAITADLKLYPCCILRNNEK